LTTQETSLLVVYYVELTGIELIVAELGLRIFFIVMTKLLLQNNATK